MGRKRIHVDPHEPLPKGLQKVGRQFRSRHPGHAWQNFGSDYGAAIVAFKAWQNARADARTVAGLLDTFIGRACPDKVAAKRMAPRTARDYGRDVPVLKGGLGRIPLEHLEPKHIAVFCEARAVNAPAHVRNEIACLSAALTWAVQNGLVATNVCRDVERPRKRVRERLISDDEYLTVFEDAGASVRLAMALCVRTLGLPADALRLGPRNVIRYPDRRRTLRFRRGKTNIQVEVEIVGDLAAVLDPLLSPATLHPTFIRRRDGKAYTVDGIGAMFRRHCVTTKVGDFGLRDLRAKGATDMFRAGVPIRQIQLLLGHKSVQTTEIYLKGLLAEIVRPNEQPIMARVK